MPPANDNPAPTPASPNPPEPAKPHLEQYNSSQSPIGGSLDLPEDTTGRSQDIPPSPHDPKPKSKKPLVIVLIVLVLSAAGIATVVFLRKDSAPSEQLLNQSNQTTEKVEFEVSAAQGTKTYTNDRMRLSIDYPENWTVTEQGNVTLIESQDFTYNTVSKGEVTGNFRIYIRQGAQSADSAYFGKGYAIVPSEKLIYSKPTTNQRKETFLSSFGLDTTDNFAYFLIAGNFELAKGDTLGPNYGKEPETYIIAGGYSSKDMKEGLETNQVPVDEYQESTAYKQAVEALKTIQIK